MSTVVQAIAVPLFLVLSAGYLVMVAWASHRRRDDVEAERQARPADPEEPAPPA